MPQKSPEAMARKRVRMRAYQKVHYRKNKKYYAAKREVSRRRLAAWFQEQKRKPCTDCGEVFNPWQMDFDHLGEKTFDLAYMKTRVSRKRLLEEIAKCELVCANCHRQRTWERANGLRS